MELLSLFHSTLEGNFMPWGDILKPGGVLEIALYVAGLVRNKTGLGHGSVPAYLRGAGTGVQSGFLVKVVWGATS